MVALPHETRGRAHFQRRATVIDNDAAANSVAVSTKDAAVIDTLKVRNPNEQPVALYAAFGYRSKAATLAGPALAASRATMTLAVQFLNNDGTQRINVALRQDDAAEVLRFASATGLAEQSTAVVASRESTSTATQKTRDSLRRGTITRQ